MLEDETYREWTAPFTEGLEVMEGSYYEGDWSEGGSMRFLTRDKDGNPSGMYSIVAENRPYEFLSLQHLGEIHKGEEKPWPTSDGRENYTFIEKDGGTELQVDLLGIPDELKGMFDESWPQALDKLKELAEAKA